MSPIARREAVVGLSTSTWRYERQSDPINTQLLARLTAHASGAPAIWSNLSLKRSRMDDFFLFS